MLTETSPDNVTRLLNEAADGEHQAAAELLPMVYDALRSLAAGYFINERQNHTLQPTALVHEAYVRLVNQAGIEWKSRSQFYVVAAKAMRNILVDHARGKNRVKRGGGWNKVALDGLADRGPDLDADLDYEALDRALTKLAELDERKARLVELRFFAGLSSPDAAGILEISRTTAAEQWRMARAWLHRELKDTIP